MKTQRNHYPALVSLVCLVAVAMTVRGQCDPDFDFAGAAYGSSPVSGGAFLPALVGSDYQDIWHLLVPASAAGIDSTYPPTLPIDSVIVLGDMVNSDGTLSGIVFTDTATNESFHPHQIGLEVLVNNNGVSPNENTLLGGTQCCAAFQGIPTRPGWYEVAIDMEAWATIFTPFNAPYTFSFSMHIFDEGSLGCTDWLACNFDPTATLADGSCDYSCHDCSGVPSPENLGHPFISEYVEGWSNNKAIEIFNPTNEVLDMTQYRLERYSNGATSAASNQSIDLMGQLQPQDVFVYTLDKQDPDGVDFEAPVWDELAQATDYWLCPVYDVNNTMYFNGNDALVLWHIPSNAVVDIFGRIGEDPGTTGWAEMTQNHTLVRKPFLYEGDTDAVDSFLVVDEWDGLLWSNDPQNYTLDDVFSNLGVHVFCNNPGGEGCTDPAACNFNPEATIDDGTCTTACGCTDPSACNYDDAAAADDGSCCTCVESVHPLGLLNRTWKFSPEAGAIGIGPAPLSTEWYASPAGGLVDFQYDDRWTFTALGSMVYDNNGGTMNPFEGYVETVMTVEPTTFEYAPAGPFLGLPAITISTLLTEVSELCGWFGAWDSGPTYEVVELTDSTLVVLALQQGGDCVNFAGSGFFTLKFVAADTQDVTEADGATEGICISGCLDPNACNYVPQAEYDSGNCNYACFGCSDVEAFNYDEEATVNDGSCFYTSCDDLGNPLWAANADIGLHVPTSETLVHGVGVSTQWVLNLPAVIQEPSSQQLFATHSWTGLVLSGLPNGLTPDTVGVELSLGGSEQACVAIAGVPEMPGTFDVEVTGSLAVSVFGSPFEIGPFTTVTSVTVLPNPNPIPGCTYAGAVNFAGYANLENGSCVYAGCTDPEALNFYPFITLDDGSCVYGDVVDPTCPSDIDQDGAVTTSDLLNLLSTFGLDCQ